MGKLGIMLAVVLIAVIIAGGLAYFLLFKSKSGGIVNITSVTLYVDPNRVTELKTPIEVHVGVHNSFPVNVDIKEGKLTLVIDELNLAKISIPSQEVKKGDNDIVLNTVIDNTLLDEFWYRHLSNGEKSNMTLNGYIVFDTPVDRLKIPVKYSKVIQTHMFPVEKELNKEYDLGIAGKIVVEKIRVNLADITPSETKLEASITIRNELKHIPLYVKGLVFRLELPDGTILGSGEQQSVKSIAAGETDTIVFNIVLDNSKIPILWYKHIRNREDTKIIIEAWLKVNVAGKNIELFKENPLKTTIEFKTNIFKYKS